MACVSLRLSEQLLGQPSPAAAGKRGEWDVYTDLAKRNPVFDTKLAAINDALGRISSDAELTDEAIHALIFYMTGELVRREVGMAGDAHYMPYAYRFDVNSKGKENERAALEQNWQAFLDGKVPYEEALRNLVRDATRSTP